MAVNSSLLMTASLSPSPVCQRSNDARGNFHIISIPANHRRSRGGRVTSPRCKPRQLMAQAPRKRSADYQTLPTRLEIVDVEKKKGLSKYYVYVIRVTCRDGSQYYISRRYRQFDEMQRLLEQRFPVEAGEFSQKERILPTLPGKLYLSRSAVREVTDKRLPQLNSYLQHLFSLPDNIRYDSIVKAFTRQTPHDRENTDFSHFTKPSAKPARPAPPTQSHTPIKAPTPPRPAPPTRHTAPPTRHTAPPTRHTAPPTKPPPPAVVRGPRGKALYPYTGQYSDELTFPAGAVIAIEAEVDRSWVLGRLGGTSGLVPLTYISVIEPLSSQGLDDGVQSDEWDSEEEVDDDSASFVTLYVGGVASSVQVGPDLVRRPTFLRLRNAIQDHLGRRNIVLNYRDIDGDLIEIVDQSDLDLMTQTTPTQPPTLYITDQGDHTPYNTHPYR